jgi:two-component system secretion system response regulator SalR
MAGRGLTGKEIAKALGITRRTVKEHLTNVHQRLRVDSTVAAVVRGLELGLVRLEDLAPGVRLSPGS